MFKIIRLLAKVTPYSTTLVLSDSHSETKRAYLEFTETDPGADDNDIENYRVKLYNGGTVFFKHYTNTDELRGVRYTYLLINSNLHPKIKEMAENRTDLLILKRPGL